MPAWPEPPASSRSFVQRRETLPRPARGHAEQVRRLRRVHLHDLRSGLQRETQRLTLGVQRHAHRPRPGPPRSGRGTRRRRGPRGIDPEIVSQLPGRNMRCTRLGELDPRRVSGATGPVLVELREGAVLSVGDRQRGPVLPVGPDERATDPLGLQALLEPPPGVAPQDRRRPGPRRRGGSPRGPRSAPCPPATWTNPTGRWIAPSTNRSTSNSLSIEGFAATQTITRGTLPAEVDAALDRCQTRGRGEGHDHRRGQRRVHEGHPRGSVRVRGAARVAGDRPARHRRRASRATRSGQRSSSSSDRAPGTRSPRTRRGRPRSTAPTT